jgi:sulfide dehydrogenase [flavocytochrome c] flavoprotein subunit
VHPIDHRGHDAKIAVANTCYSYIRPDWGISVASVYRVTDGKPAEVQASGGISPANAAPEFRQQEARYAEGWYAAITADTWG